MSQLQIIKDEFKRRIYTESFIRISKCLSLLSEEKIWQRPNNNLVSIANLILHLEGNIRQWVICGIGNDQDNRDRHSEFERQDKVDSKIILDQLKTTIEVAILTVNNISPQELTQERKVQGFDENVLSILIHVIEHTSYHTGQITFYTKLLENVDTNYYPGIK